MPYYHLNPAERFFIYKLRVEQKSIRAIARILSRHPSTISREINRNSLKKESYWDESAQRLARERKKIPRTQKRKEHTPLYDVVIKGLIKGFSPEIISGRIKREFRSSKMRISPEAIYHWIYADSKQGGVLYKMLIRSHKVRRKQRYSKRKRHFKDRVSIQDRPKVIDDKVRIGDWESDSVEGARSKGALATHVERKSRFLVAGKLKDRRSKTFMTTSIRLFNGFDKRFIKSFTVDNGSEFAEFKRLEKATESRVYFADPYSPWQRGLNENTNGLLRRYFPKGCNFLEIDDSLIQKVVDKLNHRPRKCLKFRTPYEVLFKIQGVALRS